MSLKLILLAIIYIFTGGTIFKGNFTRSKIVIILAGLVGIGMSLVFWKDVYDEGIDLLAEKLGERIESNKQNTTPEKTPSIVIPINSDSPNQDEAKLEKKSVHSITICTLSRKINAMTKQVSKTVIIQQASTELVVAPPVMETVSKRIMVIPEHRNGATFQNGLKTILVQEAFTDVKKIPAVFEENVEIAYFEDASVSKQYNKKYLKRPAHAVQRVVPAVTKDIEIQKIQKNGPDSEGLIPAVFMSHSLRIMKTPAQVYERVIPAVAKTLYADVITRPAQSIFGDGPCKYKSADKLIYELQSKLKANGYFTGEKNGNWSNALSDSILMFQKAEHLTVLGKPTLELLESLNIDYKRI